MNGCDASIEVFSLYYTSKIKKYASGKSLTSLFLFGIYISLLFSLD